MMKLRILAVALIALFTMVSLNTLNNVAKADGDQLTYVGTKKCKMCHSSAKKGAQYKAWQKDNHAKAYETLASDKSKEIAKGLGIDDPQKDEKCLKCHVTAYGVDAKYLGKKYKMEDGVGCESCHGAGEKYINKKVMTAITEGNKDGASLGLLEPNEEVCKECHNEESPTYKDFNFAERVKEIAHPMPESYLKSKGYPVK